MEVPIFQILGLGLLCGVVAWIIFEVLPSLLGWFIHRGISAHSKPPGLVPAKVDPYTICLNCGGFKYSKWHIEVGCPDLCNLCGGVKSGPFKLNGRDYMCKCENTCKKEVKDEILPGQVRWSKVESVRVLVTALVPKKADYPVKGVILDGVSDYCGVSYHPDDIGELCPDQSHDVILPNMPPKPFELEVGKVYESEDGIHRVLIIRKVSPAFKDNYPYIGINLRTSIMHEFTNTGHYLANATHAYNLVRLSPNQSREIIIGEDKC